MSIVLNRLQAPENFLQLYSSAAELRGPRGNEDIRVHSSWRLPSVVMVKLSGKLYVVDQDLHSQLAGHMFTCELRAAFSNKGGEFVWAVRDSVDTLKAAADSAVANWIRVNWDSKEKSYKVEQVTEVHAEPVWNFARFEDLLDVAVKNRILNQPDHEVVQAVLQKKKKKGA